MVVGSQVTQRTSKGRSCGAANFCTLSGFLALYTLLYNRGNALQLDKTPARMADGTPATTTTGSRWKTVRPWLPPRSTSALRRLELEVVDVSSTAVSLSVFAPATGSEEGAAAAEAVAEAEDAGWTGNAAPAISIKLNGRPWSQVAHAGAPVGDDLFPDDAEDDGEAKKIRRRSSSSLSRRENGSQGATIVIYGLEPGKEYEIELDVLDGDEADDDEEVSEATEARRSRITTRSSTSIRHLGRTSR